MTIALIALIVLLALALAALALQQFGRVARPSRVPAADTRRILFPFVAQALSTRALDAALRLANAEDATLVPIFIAIVPAHLPINATLTRQSETAIPLQEAIEHRASEFGVPVDARIERGRTNRHALRQTIAHERFDRIVIAAAAKGSPGFDSGDVAWLLNHAAGEIVVLRPSKEQQLSPPTRPGRRHHTRPSRDRHTNAPTAAAQNGRVGSTATAPRERIPYPG